MAIDPAAQAAAEAAARQRALEAAREAEKRAQEAAAQKAAEAAKAQQASKVTAVRKTFKADEMSSGRGGALRRNAVSMLGAQGLDAKQPVTATTAAAPSTKADPTQDAAKLAAIQDPAQRAQAFAQLVTQNKDPGYRTQLIGQAKPSLDDMAQKVWNRSSGVSSADRQAALNTLARTTEQLDPASQQALATTFAATMKDSNVGDNSGDFGTLMKASVEAGSGATFGVRLASALQTAGKTTAANDLSKFVGQGISDLRSRFEDDNKKVTQLYQELGQETATWKLDGKDQTTALKQFDADHHLNAAQAQLEKDGAALASTLDGAGLAETDPALKAGAAAKQTFVAGRAGAYSVDKYSNESSLLSASHDALGDVSALSNTKAGSEAIAQAMMAQGSGQPNFLQQAVSDAQNAPSAQGLSALRTAVTQSMGSKLLESARAGTFDETRDELLAGLQKNSKLFGVNPTELQGFTDALKQFKPGMTEAALESATKSTASKIGSLNAPGPVGQAFRGLSVIFGAVGAVNDWSNFDASSVQQKIATISQTLNVGQGGANLITGTLSRFAANSAETAAEAGAVAPAVAEEAGLTAGKLLGAGIGALGTVVSGWQAVDAFEAGNTTQGVGDSITALGGAVATAGLFLDGTILGAEAGVVLNVVGGVIAAAGGIVSLFGGSGNPFSGQEQDLDGIFQKLGVNKDVADQLKGFNSDGQNFGTWVSAVAGQLHMNTGDFVRSMNGWTSQQVTDFLDAARLQHDTDDNNSNRLKNASAVLGKQSAQNLEDVTTVPMGRFGGYNPNAEQQAQAQQKAQAAERLKVDKTTGAITYDPQLVTATVAWLRNGRKTS